MTQTSLSSGVKKASCGDLPTYVICLTWFVAVSMKATELEPIDTTARVFDRREAHTVNQQLAEVQGAQVLWSDVSELDYAEQRISGWIID